MSTFFFTDKELKPFTIWYAEKAMFGLTRPDEKRKAQCY
jgi:hypothetical protein